MKNISLKQIKRNSCSLILFLVWGLLTSCTPIQQEAKNATSDNVNTTSLEGDGERLIIPTTEKEIGKEPVSSASTVPISKTKMIPTPIKVVTPTVKPPDSVPSVLTPLVEVVEVDENNILPEQFDARSVYLWPDHALYEVDSATLYTMPEAEWSFLGLSPNGCYFLFSVMASLDGAERSIIRFDRQKQHQTILEDTFPIANMSWSPDSQWISYANDGQAGHGDTDVFLLSYDGQQQIQVTSSPSISEYPLGWLQQDSQLMYAIDHSQIMVYDLELQERRLLLDLETIEEIQPASDAFYVRVLDYFAFEDGNIKLRVVMNNRGSQADRTFKMGFLDVATGDFLMIFDGMEADAGYFDRATSWSPDGTRVAIGDDFTLADSNEKLGFYIVDTIEGTSQLINTQSVNQTEVPVSAQIPTWSPDGNNIIFQGWGQVAIYNLPEQTIYKLEGVYGDSLPLARFEWLPQTLNEGQCN